MEIIDLEPQEPQTHTDPTVEATDHAELTPDIEQTFEKATILGLVERPGYAEVVSW